MIFMGFLVFIDDFSAFSTAIVTCARPRNTSLVQMCFWVRLSGILYVTHDVEYGQIPSSFRYRETVVTVRSQKYGLIPHEA
jgi:hypothetical protein